MRDFTINLTHRPGELADVANALSLKGVNIKSLAALNLGNQALMRLIPDDVDAAPMPCTTGTFVSRKTK